MTLTKEDLVKLIKEEMSAVIEEGSGWVHSRVWRQAVEKGQYKKAMLALINMVDELTRNQQSLQRKKDAGAEKRVNPNYPGMVGAKVAPSRLKPEDT